MKLNFFAIFSKCFKALIPISLLMFLVFYSVPGAAENREIIFAVEPDGWPPVHIVDGESITGISMDILKEVTSKYGYTFRVKQFPEKRGVMMLESGEIHAWGKAREWIDNPERFDWTEPMLEIGNVLVSRASEPVTYSKPEDIFGMTVGTQLGYGYKILGPYFKSGQIKRHDVTSRTRMLKILLLGRVDVATFNKLIILWIIKNNNKMDTNQFHFEDMPSSSVSYRWMFSKKHGCKKFIEVFNKEIKSMKQDGRLTRILSQYQ